MAWDDTKIPHVSVVAAADYNALVTYVKTLGKKLTISDEEPAGPADSDLWYAPSTGIVSARVSGAWVDLTLSGPAGPQGEQGPQGPPGEDGADGADGKTVLSGAGAPDPTDGADGDFYIDTVTSTLYGPKATTWPTGVSLIGPQGESGVAGALDDLSDVTITTPSDDQFLRFNGTNWVNETVSIGGGASVSQVTPTAVTIAHATTDAAAGKTASIDLTANHGMMTRLRFYADFTAGQQTAWSGLVNQANGYDPDDTSIAFDGAVGTLTAGDYVKWGEEICLVGGSGTISTPMTLTRAQKGTTATYHPDNEQMVKLNDGIRLEFYPNSNYLPEERLFSWYGIMTGKWTTAAAISAGAQVLYTTADPSVVSDFGFDSLILIDDTTDEIARVASVFGDVANASFDKSIFVQGTLAAHDTTKTIYRVAEFDVPIPFKLASEATTLYVKMFVDEAITGTVTGTLEVVADKWS